MLLSLSHHVPACQAVLGRHARPLQACRQAVARWHKPGAQPPCAAPSSQQLPPPAEQEQASPGAPAAVPQGMAPFVSPTTLRSLALASAALALPALLPAVAHAASAAAGASSGGGFASLAQSALSFVLHLDVHLGEIVAKYGRTTYYILFAIVFAETGLVVTPFLPGDSLLFATGALAALGKLNLWALVGCYIAAATLGDAVNYAIGNYLGSAAFKSRLLKREHIAKTEEFYAKYGGKTVVLARFVPIVRTFAPFVAGVGSMPYAQFGLYNVAGAVLWTAICVGAGFAFGNVPAVHENFSLVVLGIVLVSLLPIVWEMYAARRAAAAAAAQLAADEAAAAASAAATTPPAAAAAVAATTPPRQPPAVAAAAAVAVEKAKEKVAASQAGGEEPAQQAQQDAQQAQQGDADPLE